MIFLSQKYIQNNNILVQSFFVTVYVLWTINQKSRNPLLLLQIFDHFKSHIHKPRPAPNVIDLTNVFGSLYQWIGSLLRNIKITVWLLISNLFREWVPSTKHDTEKIPSDQIYYFQHQCCSFLYIFFILKYSFHEVYIYHLIITME